MFILQEHWQFSVNLDTYGLPNCVITPKIWQFHSQEWPHLRIMDVSCSFKCTHWQKKDL